MIKYILFYFISSFAFADTFYCTHIEICNLAKKYIGNETILKEVVSISGDPHEFEPTPSDIKNLISVPILLTGPFELNPWMKKILYQRSKKIELKTYALYIPDNISKKYDSNKEALSHFWLYPDLYCDFANQINNWKLTGTKNNQSEKCDSSKLKEYEQKLKKISTTIILTHDALLPILKSVSPKSVKIISLKGSGHHEEISAQSIKELYKSQNDSKRIWIIEKNINIPNNILNKINSNDKKIIIDTSNYMLNNSISTLEYIIEEIAK